MSPSPQISPMQLKSFAYEALQAARRGREVLNTYFGRVKNIEEKFQAGLVSEADKEAEKAVVGYLRTQFPDHAFLGEESAPKDWERFRQSEQPLWIIDPLDGTTNYIHGFPVFAVSVGLYWGGEAVVGVVDAPKLGEVYCAWKGGGSYCNGSRLSVSQTTSVNKALLATGFFSEIEEQLVEQTKIFGLAVRKARAIRRPGAASMDLCWVAKGVFDGYWEKGLSPWDVCAGAVIVNEAGGVVSNYPAKDRTPESPYSVFDRSIVAGTPALVPELRALIQSSFS